MSNTSPIPAAIQGFVDATNTGDSDAFVAAFTADAFLDDWGRQFHGPTAITSWNQTDNIGRNAHFDLHAVRQGTPLDEYLASLTVSGDGFNGPGVFTFQLRDGLICRLVIA